MSLLNRIEELEKELLELKEQVEQEKEFPQKGDEYWLINGDCSFQVIKWNDDSFDNRAYEIGNIYRTKEEAEFVVEKIRIEAELRKFSRPFKDNDNNYFIELYLFDKTLSIDSSEYFQTQGTIYFESTTIANEAIDAIGENRIKKYIFGVRE